jgi:predicted ATPase
MNLPTFLSSFVGRDVAVARLGELLTEHRLVTLVGPGGIGKTRLALQTVTQLAERYAGGVVLVELGQLDHPEDVTPLAASVLGVRGTAGPGLLADIVASLRSQQMIVVLDNCEHVIDKAGELAVALATGCPKVTVLATSREGLAVPGEQVWPVAPLRVDTDAVALFDDRARNVAPAFELDVHRPAVQEICRRLDGVPLAIELAAAQVQALAPSDIASLLDDRFRLLSAGRRAGVERHRTLRAAVEWSHDLLDPAGRMLFARLAAFTGWFDLAAVRAVCGFDPLDPFLAIDALGRLVAQSMVVGEDRPAGRRYRLLETMRQFGLELLATQDPDRLALRHAHHHRDWIERLRTDLEGSDEVRALAQVDDGWDNLRTAHAWAIDHGDVDTAVRISAALSWETHVRNRFEAAGWAHEAIGLPDAEDHPKIIDAFLTATQGPAVRRQSDSVSRLIEQAFELCLDRGQEPSAALRLAQGMHAWSTVDFAKMQALAEDGCERARRSGDAIREAACLVRLSSVHGFNDDTDTARALAARAAAVARATGNPTIELLSDQNLVMMLPDYRLQLKPVRNLLERALPLRTRFLDQLAIFATGLEARAGNPTRAAAELHALLQRLVDTDALEVWYFMAPDIFFVLARNDAFTAAATLHGHAERYLAYNPARTPDDTTEYTRISTHLPPQQLTTLACHGATLNPTDMAALVLTELHAIGERVPGGD